MSRLVIAEIGINHDGDVGTAKKLILDASKSGCYGIKFQYRNVARTYGENVSEIGDEILQKHISNSYLSASTLLSLQKYAIDLGLKVGISFFTTEDLDDFGINVRTFDFFKVPSAELLNENLIDKLLTLNKMVYLSTGMHNEEEIESAFVRLENHLNWMPLHCISNYPLANHNAQLGQIPYLQRWKRGVGYSSHDMCWETCVAALTMGASVIERHITYSKKAEGLDHSSSSDFKEFLRICEYANEIDSMLMGEGPRNPNQGELLNRQNLGRSFYARENLKIGQKFSAEFFNYRSPQIGLGYRELRNLADKTLLKPLKKGEAITASHLFPTCENLEFEETAFAAEQAISIPIRLKDHRAVREKLSTKHYEFHLSYGEISKIEDYEVSVFNDERYSVHLPDYISHKDLINPWSDTDHIRKESLHVLTKTMEFSEKLSNLTGKPVPVVASLAGLNLDKAEFFQRASALFEEYKSNQTFMTLQWLPPIAWYFGGSVKLPHANNLVDAKYIQETGIQITLDASHLILGRNFFGFDALEILEILENNISHVHLSDATGLDGEGIQISASSINSEVIQRCLKFKTMKVIEVWQGHLDDFAGFRKAIKEIYKMRSNL